MRRKRDNAYARKERMYTPDNPVACRKNECVSENMLCVVLSECMCVCVCVCVCVTLYVVQSTCILG